MAPLKDDTEDLKNIHASLAGRLLAYVLDATLKHYSGFSETSKLLHSSQAMLSLAKFSGA